MGKFTTPTPVGPVYTAARQVHAAAVEHKIRGMLELRTEAYEFPHTLAEVAAAIRTRAEYYGTEAVEPEYAHMVAAVAATVDAAADAARRLGEAFDALHQAELRRLLAPRPNEEKWDVSQNRP
jgi:hypothetical protein